MRDNECEENVIEEVIDKWKSRVKGSIKTKNVKDISRRLFQLIRNATNLPNLGNRREEFVLEHLIPALSNTPNGYREVREDVFGTG